MFTHTHKPKLIYLYALTLTKTFMLTHSNTYTVTYSLISGRCTQLSKQSVASKRHFLCVHFCATHVMGLVYWSDDEKLPKKESCTLSGSIPTPSPWNSVLLREQPPHCPPWGTWEKCWLRGNGVRARPIGNGHNGHKSQKITTRISLEIWEPHSMKSSFISTPQLLQFCTNKWIFLEGLVLGSETINLVAHRPSQSTDSCLGSTFLNFEFWSL